jgi:hypothetical protein
MEIELNISWEFLFTDCGKMKYIIMITNKPWKYRPAVLLS